MRILAEQVSVWLTSQSARHYKVVGVTIFFLLLGIGGRFASVIKLLAAYLLVLAVISNGHRIQGFSHALFIRRFSYFVPYLLSFLWVSDLPNLGADLLPTTLGAACGGLLVLLNLKAFRRLYEPTLLYITGPYPVHLVATNTISMLGSAVIQEIFYKGLFVGNLFPIIGFWAVLAGGALFTLEHTFNKYSRGLFSSRDYLFQFTLSCLLGWVFVETGSLAAAIAGHLIYNMPIIAAELLHLPRLWSRFAGGETGGERQIAERG